MRSEALAPPAPFSRTPHLVSLVADTERLSALLAAAAPPDEVRERAEARAAVASLRLDGSRLESPPDPAQLHAHPAIDVDAAEPRAGSWLAAFRLDEVEDESVQVLEYQRVREALASDDLAASVLADLRPTLEELHRRLTETLVADEVRGRLRRTQQAVHDASVGKVLFRAPDPEVVEARLGAVEAWVATAAAREHGLVVSGVLHLELLALHPFEAANGRLARAAARLALRARGLDPHRLAAPEPALADDAIGYHLEVPATRRRRDVTIWLERWGEAVSAGLRAAARDLGLLDTEVPARARDFLRHREEPGFTIVDYRAEAEVSPEDARADIDAMLDAGSVARVAGARGLRFAVRDDERA